MKKYDFLIESFYSVLFRLILNIFKHFEHYFKLIASVRRLLKVPWRVGITEVMYSIWWFHVEIWAGLWLTFMAAQYAGLKDKNVNATYLLFI